MIFRIVILLTFCVSLSQAEIIGYKLFRPDYGDIKCSSYWEDADSIVCERSGSEIKIRKDSVAKIEPIHGEVMLRLPEEVQPKLEFSKREFEDFESYCTLNPYKKNGWSSWRKAQIEEFIKFTSFKLTELQVNPAEKASTELDAYKLQLHCLTKAIEKGYYKEQMEIWNVKD
jgi:hypothetical protein